MVRELEDELVLVTSYFNLVDGRRQDAADSFRVDPNLPSRSSPDGTAALYVVTEASTGGHMGPRARRIAADTVAWEYSSRGDDPPVARLRAALRAAHQELLREFEGHVTVGMTVLVVEKNTVYLGQVSPGQVYVLHTGNLSSLTANAGGSSPYSRALGTTGNPSIQVFRDTIETDDILCLCSSWFQRAADQGEIREAFGAGTADDIADALLGLAQQHDVQSATAIVIEAALASEVEPEPDDVPAGTLMEQVDSAIQTLAGMGKQLWAELLTPTEPDLEDSQNGADSPGPEAEDPPAGLATPERRRRVREQHTIETPLVDEMAPPAEHNSSSLARAEPADTEQAQTRDLGQSLDHTALSQFEAYRSPADASSQDDAPVQQGLEEQTTEEVPAVRPSPTPQTPDAPAGRTPVPATVPPADAGDSNRRSGTASAGATSPESRAGAGTMTEEAEAEASPTQPTGAADSSTTVGDRASGARPVKPPDRTAKKADALDSGGRAAQSGTIAGRTAETAATSSTGARPVRQSVVADPASEIDAVNSRLQSGPDMKEVIPPVQAFPEASTTEPERIYATSKDVDAVNKRRPRRFGGISRSGKGDVISGGPPVVTPGSVDLDMRRPVVRAAPPAVIWAAIAVVGILAAGALYIFFHNRSHSTINNYPALAHRDIALAASAKTPAKQDLYLKKAHTNIALSRQHGASSATVASLQRKLQSTSDTIYGVTRVTAASVVADFSQFPHAAPAQLATGTSVIYSLDTGRHSVFSITPGSKTPATEIIQDGEQITGIAAGTPVQLTNDGATALVLDDKTNLISDNNGTKAAQTLAQPANTPTKPSGMASVDPDIYILDPANSQVWRYPGAAGGLSPTPQGFFPSPGPKLGDAVGITMDGTSMWILERSGNVLKYDMQAHQQPFSLSLRLPLKNPNAIYTDAGLNYVWIADPANQRIVQVDKAGHYSRSYASGTAAINLSQVKSIAVPPGGKTLYVLTSSKLYSFPVVP